MGEGWGEGGRKGPKGRAPGMGRDKNLRILHMGRVRDSSVAALSQNDKKNVGLRFANPTKLRTD